MHRAREHPAGSHRVRELPVTMRQAVGAALSATLAVLLFLAYCLLILAILLLANAIPSW